jgi:hypothetical protein
MLHYLRTAQPCRLSAGVVADSRDPGWSGGHRLDHVRLDGGITSILGLLVCPSISPGFICHPWLPVTPRSVASAVSRYRDCLVSAIRVSPHSQSEVFIFFRSLVAQSSSLSCRVRIILFTLIDGWLTATGDTATCFFKRIGCAMRDGTWRWVNKLPAGWPSHSLVRHGWTEMVIDLRTLCNLIG